MKLVLLLLLLVVFIVKAKDDEQATLEYHQNVDVTKKEVRPRPVLTIEAATAMNEQFTANLRKTQVDLDRLGKSGSLNLVANHNVSRASNYTHQRENNSNLNSSPESFVNHTNPVEEPSNNRNP
mmetsp:Transcript_17960/g.15876  ORF Transcript_17960/g.15876 Transcript_17960/m.15876 type:complete len:124 (+) Transcript_17960:14-385(+)